MHLSTYGATAFLNSVALPATLYMKLHVGNPSASGAANPAAETARKAYTRGVAVAGIALNDSLLEWLNAAADEDITHITAWDTVGPAGGNCWFIGQPTNLPINVLTGQTISVDIGLLVHQMTIWS